MRYVFLLTAILACSGCSAKRGTVLIDTPVQLWAIRVPGAYPTKTAGIRGHEIGSDAQVAGQPSARRTTVRR